jgi:capsular exopolysaccharide synthesis family protein
VTSILFARERSHNAIAVAVTSANPGEGKTTIVANLGAALGESGCRTLLIDLDLRRPALHSALGMRNGAGVAELLCGERPIQAESLTVETPLPNVSVITAGRDVSIASELLVIPRIEAALKALREHWDVILIDTPPLLVPDARRVAHCAGAALLVIRALSTSRDQAVEACKLLAQDRTPILGTVFNACPEVTARYKSYGYYSKAGRR